MNSQEIIELLQNDIDRQAKEFAVLGLDESDYRTGFVAGIMHAIRLIKASSSVVNIPHEGKVS